jgi:hypothetical protein
MVSEAPRTLTGGLAAYNEEGRIGTALRSLLAQRLPPGVRWDRIYVVASGCTDRTLAEVERVQREYPQVSAVVERERRGKASALREIFARARGDYLVLLNADAQADPDAVSALLDQVRGQRPPFAVMGRPEPPPGHGREFSPSVELLWQVHHEVHEYLVRRSEATHLSDELLLLPVAELPPMPEEVVNDGAFVGAWLRQIGGTLLYAPSARVRIEAPTKFADHVRQRRRIRFGHAQIAALTGISPTTWDALARHRPRAALRLLGRSLRSVPSPTRALVGLVTAEITAIGQAAWDRRVRRRSYRLWEPVRAGSGPPPSSLGSTDQSARSRVPFDQTG